MIVIDEGRTEKFQCLYVFKELSVRIEYILHGLVELLFFFGCEDELLFEKKFDELCPSWLNVFPFFVTYDLFRLSSMLLSITINYNTYRP